MHYILTLAVLSLAIAPAAFGTDLHTTIEKHSGNRWSITYTVDSPINQLSFKRNPDDSRTRFWKPKNSAFHIVRENDMEMVRRTDGRPFSVVEFLLLPSYRHIPKEYAPFSPFSDGGIAVHSGRFFACVDKCTSDHNQWNITLVTPDEDRIIVNGDIYNKSVSFTGSDSGAKLYIGPGETVDNGSFVALIDPGLPSSLSSQIAEQFPRLMSYFRQQLGALEYRPALYASYSDSTDGSYGHQGGVLPGQIFMHWNGRKSLESIDVEETRWFIAHETAHLFQKRAAEIEDKEDSWVHEGAAELFAGLAYQSISEDSRLLKSKVNDAKSDCMVGFTDTPSFADASSQAHTLYYSCGLAIMSFINSELVESDKISIFELWQQFNDAVEQGRPASAETFVNIARPYIRDDHWGKLWEFASNRDANGLKIMQTLLAE